MCFEAFALIKMITINSRCEEFEGELASIREDVIDSLEDGWVVKSVRHHQLSSFSISCHVNNCNG